MRNNLTREEHDKRIEYLTRAIVKSLFFAKKEPENFLSQSRKIAEGICKYIHVRDIGPIPKNAMLGNLINTLDRRNLISERIVLILKTIQLFGNYGSHSPNKDFDELKGFFVLPCEKSLKYLSNWFYKFYLKTKVPEKILLFLKEENVELPNNEIEFTQEELILEKAINKYDYQNYKSAIKDFKSLIKKGVNDSFVFYMLGSSHFELEQYRSAISALTKAIDLDSSLINAVEKRGMARLKSGTHNTALEDFNRLIYEHPKNSEYYLNRGICLYHTYQYKEAFSSFNKAIKLDPGNEEITLNCGHAKYGMKEYDSAIHYYTQSINLDPESSRAYLYRGNVYFDQQNHKFALDDYNRSLEINDTDTDALFKRADLYFEHESYWEAFNDWREVTKIDNWNYASHFNAGLCLFNLGYKENENQHYKDAITWFQVAAKNYADKRFLRDSHYQIGLCYKELGEKSNACNHFKQAAVLKDQRAEEMLKKYCSSFIDQIFKLNKN